MNKLTTNKKFDLLAQYFDWDLNSEQTIQLRELVIAVVKEEREACARVAYAVSRSDEIAQAILAREEEVNE